MPQPGILNELLTEQEVEALLVAAENGGITTQRGLNRVVEWAQKVRAEQTLLELALLGEIAVKLAGDEIAVAA